MSDLVTAFDAKPAFKHRPHGGFAPGTAPGPGRKAIPAWLKDKSDEMLRIQYDAAITGLLPIQYAPGQPPKIDPETGEEITHQIVQPQDRLRVLDKLVDRVIGKAPAAPEDREQREKGVADLLAALAVEGPKS